MYVGINYHSHKRESYTIENLYMSMSVNILNNF